MELNVQGLKKQFKRNSFLGLGAARSVQAVDDVSFAVPPGQALGIVGESGSGKTTVLKILAGFESADAGSATLGEKSLLTLPMRERARLLQMVFQDPFASLNPKLLLRTQLAEALGVRSFDNIAERLAASMSEVGLPTAFLERYPHQLSGGQRQRFALARALAARPAVLLADEPVSSLDIAVQAQIINLLNDLRRKHGFALVLISHDVAVIVNTCERMIVMKVGRVVERGDVESVIASPADPYTQRLLSAVPRLESHLI
jgi:ABC-type glutathione transport system ATPase component